MRHIYFIAVAEANHITTLISEVFTFNKSGVNAKELVQDLPNEGRFAPSQKVLVLRNKIIKFMEEHIYPMEEEFYKLSQSEARWTVHPAEEKLKELAKKEGLWNLWIPVRIYILLFCDIFYL